MEKETEKEIKNFQELSEEDKLEFLDDYTKGISHLTPAITALRLEKEYPKAYKTIVDYVLNLDTNTIAPSSKELEMNMITLLTYNSRVLYEIFDKNEIYLNIMGSKDTWYHNLNINNTVYSTRIFAEQAGFLEGFKILETK